MLPTSGYFKNVLCPFFKNGLCERHNCHFGHTKIASSSSGRSLLGRRFPDTSKDFVDVLDKAEILNTTSIEQTFRGMTYGEERADLHYIPTPVDRGIPKAPSILKKSKAVKYPLTEVPEYRPTPISRLKPLSVPDSSEENSLESLNVPALSKKRKKVEEYDPTEVRCSFKKKVSFNLPADHKDSSCTNEDELSGKSVTCIVIDSSDDDELGITPQFSDDEDEEGRISDDACAPITEIKKEKPDIMDFDTNQSTDTFPTSTPECKTYSAEISDFNKSQVGCTFPTGSSEYKTCSPEVSDCSLVDKVPLQVKKDELIKDGNKSSFKSTSTAVSVPDSDSKGQKSHKSEFKNSEKNSSNKHHGEKPKKLNVKSKQESCSDSVSHSRLKDGKLHKDGSKLHVSKTENSAKHATSGKQKSEKPVCSNRSSGKILPEKKNQAQHQNKVDSASVMCPEEVRNKLQKPKVKSEHVEVDSKDRAITKHNDSLKSKNSTKCSERDSKNVSKNKSKSHSKDPERVIKAKDVKIQDEKVSSSCQASNKKHVASEKRHSSSPTKKKPKLTNDEKAVVKTKTSSAVHKSSQDSEFSKLETKKNSDKKIQCNVQGSLQEDSNLKSPLHEFTDSDDVHFPASDSDMDSDTLEDCLRIFNEHEQRQAQQKGSFEEAKDEKKENIAGLVKKRVAHQMDLPKPKVPRLKPPVNPSQVMHNRYLQLQEMYSRQNSADEKKVPSAFMNSTSKGIETYKKRITIAPNADLVAAVTQKQKLLQSSGDSCPASQRLPADEITYVVTETKRVARVPAQVMKPRPIIPVEYGCKVPSNIRQRYLNNFIDECLKFCSDEEEAFQTALDEEKKAYERSSNKTVYLGVAINVLKRLRNQAMEVHSTTQPVRTAKSSPEQSAVISDTKMKNKVISHEMMLGGSRAQKTSFSIEKKKPKIQDMEIRGKMLYESLMNYVLSSDQLVENGYPLPHPAEPGRALVSGIYVTKRPSTNDPFKRVCSRCQKSYQVDENGEYVKKEECEFHWGHLWQKRIGRSMERQYSCCGGDSQSDGCCVSAGHVFDGNESETLKGYVKTMPKTPPPDGYFGIYALDCEMCYTSVGIELIRVTVINPDMKAVYETFVKPENKILDYNTRFSGITEEHLNGVETSLRDVQAVLLCLFNSKTILIGHSLESDFKALKLIHTTVVDTSVVFPHRRGLPYKRALRTLMAEYMRKIIQNSLDGHDSNEDAVACMELMLWKIKEDLKRTR